MWRKKGRERLARGRNFDEVVEEEEEEDEVVEEE